MNTKKIYKNYKKNNKKTKKFKKILRGGSSQPTEQNPKDISVCHKNLSLYRKLPKNITKLFKYILNRIGTDTSKINQLNKYIKTLTKS